VNTERERGDEKNDLGRSRVSSGGNRYAKPKDKVGPSPIQFRVRLRMSELRDYWSKVNLPHGKSRTLLGYKVSFTVNTSTYGTLIAEGIPALRERLRERLEAEGFTNVRVIPGENYPYEWLREAIQ
jgi:hypothetical protein